MQSKYIVTLKIKNTVIAYIEFEGELKTLELPTVRIEVERGEDVVIESTTLIAGIEGTGPV